MSIARIARMKVASRASVTADWTIVIQPGEKLYFLSVLGDAAAAGSIILENTTITIPLGTAFTLGASDLPRDCENYTVRRQLVFQATLGPVVAIFGPVDHDPR